MWRYLVSKMLKTADLRYLLRNLLVEEINEPIYDPVVTSSFSNFKI